MKFLIWITTKLLLIILRRNSRLNDPHKYVASILLDKPEIRVTRAERTSSKLKLFQLLYRMDT